MKLKSTSLLCSLVGAIAISPSSMSAEEPTVVEPGAVDRSVEELAKELANPNTVLTSLKFKFQYLNFAGDLPGADDADMLKILFQPTLPFPLQNGKTLWVRPGVPLLFDQPVFDPAANKLGFESGLGDISLDLQYGDTLDNGFLWSVGATSVFPTASHNGLGSEQWALGPGFQLGYVKDKVVAGFFLNHVWDIAGSGDTNINLTTLQIFGVYLPGGGWSVATSPIMTYNFDTSDWTIPLNFAVGKTYKINGRPWKFALELNYYVERPAPLAPEWMIGFNVAPVVENVFVKWFAARN